MAEKSNTTNPPKSLIFEADSLLVEIEASMEAIGVLMRSYAEFPRFIVRISMKNSLKTKPGHELGPDGELIGADPRKLTQADLTALGHTAMAPVKAIRAHCLDFCGGSASEVRMCVSIPCPSWPFRMGKSPWNATRVISDTQRAALASGRSKSSQPAMVGEEVGTQGTDTPKRATLGLFLG